MNSKRQVKGELGHVLQIYVCRFPFAVNAMLSLSVVGWASVLQAGQQLTEWGWDQFLLSLCLFAYVAPRPFAISNN